MTVHLWTEAEIEHVRQLLPKIANGRKTRYSKLREQQKAQAKSPVPRKNETQHEVKPQPNRQKLTAKSQWPMAEPRKLDLAGKSKDGQRPVRKHRTRPNHKSPSKERRPMADTDSNSAQKPLVYDLLHRLNASFARVNRNMAALERVGIFDPLMMQVLNRQPETLRAGANYHLLGTMRGIEERDREKFSQLPSE